MPRRQQKALYELRLQTTEAATDRGATADWAAHRLRRASRTTTMRAGDISQSATAAKVATVQIGDVHQHLLGEVCVNMMAERMRTLQTAACYAPRLAAAGSHTGVVPTAEPNAISTRITRLGGLIVPQ